MAYVDPYDPTTPTDANSAAEGDDRVRELKRAISERLSTIIDGWPDTDPLTLNQAAVRAQESPQTPPVSVGTKAALPNPPSAVGLLYYAHDTDELFVSKQDGTDIVWDEIRQGEDQAAPVQVGTLAAQPSPPSQAGLLYFATDTQDLYVSYNNGTDLVWVNLTPAGEASAEEVAGIYTGTNTAGTRWAATTVNRKLYVRVLMNVDANGLMAIPLAELGNGTYHVDNIVTLVYDIDLTIHGGTSPIANTQHEGFELDSANNVINIWTRGANLDMWAHLYITFSQ